jgi:hypothetical protein
MEVPNTFSLPFLLLLPLSAVPTNSKWLVSIKDSSGVGHADSSALGQSSSPSQDYFLGLPLLRGFRTEEGTVSSMALSDIFLTILSSSMDDNTASGKIPVPLVGVSSTQEANKKDSQACWG